MCKPESLSCALYVTGFRDGYFAGEEQPGKICIPSGVKNTQLGDVLLNYLKAHPEIRHEAAVLFVARALFEAYPCK